jgi:ferric-dicitrate binding protein FerR (iron transport regulator)
MTDDDEDNELTSHELDAWPAMTPPEGFADRVLAARAAPVAVKQRWPKSLVVGGCAAVAQIFLMMSAAEKHPGHGEVAAVERTTVALAERGVAVAEANAQFTWRVDDYGETEIDQRAGDVFYRVEHGGPFVIHTPEGDVRVTGTCLRVEVEAMKPTKQMILSGAVGAALASAVFVTVYEGHVSAESKGTRTELTAGAHATLGGATPVALGSAGDSTPAVRAMAEQQITALRARVRELEKQVGSKERGVDAAGDGRPWYDPSHEQLVEWAAKCHVRFDEPNLDHFTPMTKLPDDNDRGIEASELDDYNAAMAEMAKQWHDLVRGLYIETTGDTAGAETLSIDAMRREVDEKSPRDEHQQILQKISRERAGLASPPADMSKTSPLERLVRGFGAVGDQSEAALARRIGAARAKAIRADGWGSKSDMSGCPKE